MKFRIIQNKEKGMIFFSLQVNNSVYAMALSKTRWTRKGVPIPFGKSEVIGNQTNKKYRFFGHLAFGKSKGL